jgi:dolichol-phosphate mannosyltransferase
MNTVSVILPTYNEADNIVPLIQALKKNVLGLMEILVVDDNSPDGTAKVVKDPKTRLIVRLTDHGLRKSIQEGITNARGEIIVWMDADFSMPPVDINKLTDAVINGADIAVGSRFISGGKTKQRGDPRDHWYTILASEIGNFIMPRLFGLNFHDYTSGFIAVRNNIARSITLRGFYGEYFIDFIVRAFARGYRIVEIPYICKPRLRGVSKTANDFPTLLKRFYQYGSMVCILLWQMKIVGTNK